MGFRDFFTGDEGRRNLGGMAAMARAMSDPAYHRAGMLGPMLLAGGGAAIGARRQEDELAARRAQEEAEREQRRLLEERQREMEEELHELRTRGLTMNLEGEERERSSMESFRRSMEEAGFDPDNPVEVDIYRQTTLQERLPKDPMDDLRRQEAELRIQGLQQQVNRGGREDPEVYKIGGTMGTLLDDPDSPGGRRFQEFSGMPEEQSDMAARYVMGRFQQLMTPPEDYSARQKWKAPSVTEAAETAQREWEALNSAMSGRGDGGPGPGGGLPRGLSMKRGRTRLEAGTDVAGVTVPPARESIPSSAGRVQFKRGSESLPPAAEQMLQGFPPGVAQGIRRQLMEDLAQGIPLEEALAELQMTRQRFLSRQGG